MDDFYHKKQVRASHALEEILIAGKEVVARLRNGDISNDLAYALMYELRWRMGHAVHIIPAEGVPPAAIREQAKDIIDSQLDEPYNHG